MHLRRTKLDANRELVEAAQGNPDATRAWTEYHAFVERAIALSIARAGTGFYLDLHGHGHAIPRLELGYLLSSSELGQTDGVLNVNGAGATSSLRLLLGRATASFAEILRGPTSLGGFLMGGPGGSAGITSVPSPAAPSPGQDPYFNGGYSTERHTAGLPGLQIETHFTGVRESAASRADFGGRLADAVARFLQMHAGLTVQPDAKPFSPPGHPSA